MHKVIACAVLYALALAPAASSAGDRSVATMESSAADSLPGVPVMCTDFRTIGNLTVRAQRLQQDGLVDAAWVPDAGRLCLGTAAEVTSRLVPDGAGGAIVVWEVPGTDATDLRVVRLDRLGRVAAGWPVGGAMLCAANGAQYGVALAPDGQGGAFAAWTDARESGTRRVYAQHVMGDAQQAWGPDGRMVNAMGEDQASPAIAAAPSGGAVVVWRDERAGTARILAATIAPDGSSTSGAGSAVSDTLADSRTPLLIPAFAGTCILTWVTGGPGAERLRALKLGPEGAPDGAWPGSGIDLGGIDGEPSPPAVGPDGIGGALVSWVDASQRVRAQRVSGTGTALWEEGGRRVCDLPSPQHAPALVGDGAGGALLVWEDTRAGEEADLWAQHVSGSGERLWSADGVPVCLSSGHQFSPAAASDTSGGLLVTWVDGPSSARASFLRARPEGLEPLPLLRQVECEAGRVRLVWEAAPVPERRLVLERRVTDGEWGEPRTLTVDGAGLAAHEDRDLLPGMRVGYRLRIERGREVMLTPSIELEVPLPRPLALHSVRVDAAGRMLSMAVTLVSNAPAQFEVLDVQGRRIESQSLGSPGAGDHLLRVALRDRLAPALFFVRLRQGAVVRTARLVVVR